MLFGRSGDSDQSYFFDYFFDPKYRPFNPNIDQLGYSTLAWVSLPLRRKVEESYSPFEAGLVEARDGPNDLNLGHFVRLIG